jgi:hypothetical protein
MRCLGFVAIDLGSLAKGGALAESDIVILGTNWVNVLEAKKSKQYIRQPSKRSQDGQPSGRH